MVIERNRYVIMCNGRKEIWCGSAKQFHFRRLDDLGGVTIKTYRSEKQARAGYSSYQWNQEDVEVLPVTERIEVIE